MAVFDWRKAHDARLRDQESRRDDPSWPCLGRKPGDLAPREVFGVLKVTFKRSVRKVYFVSQTTSRF
jgi:hypothetical protein